MYLMHPNIGYVEAEHNVIGAIEVPQRPSQFHYWDHENGEWVERVADRIGAAASTVRAARAAMLAKSDWTQGKDIPDSISGPWALYRQALRDITAQTGFPESVVWPVSPI